jgi:hypothetical protein
MKPEQLEIARLKRVHAWLLLNAVGIFRGGVYLV